MRPLIPLRIPGGWAVVFNNFVEFSLGEVPSDDDLESYLDEDLLSIESVVFDGEKWRTGQEGWIIDLGWYPAGDSSGVYHLSLVRGSWDNVSVRFEHRDCGVIKEAIEIVARSLSAGQPVEKIAQVLRDVSQTMRDQTKE